MQWVKASERLPKKTTDDLGNDRAVVFINRKESKTYGFYLSIINNIPALLNDLTDWEWLDETEQDAGNQLLQICAGCGHISTDEITPPALSCCPDSNWLPLRDFIEQWHGEIVACKKKLITNAGNQDELWEEATRIIEQHHNRQTIYPKVYDELKQKFTISKNR